MDAVFQMEFTILELKLNMQAVFNAYFHPDRWVLHRFFIHILHNKLFFFRDFRVLSINGHVDVVADTDHNAVIAFKLFLGLLELERISCVVCECSWWF